MTQSLNYIARNLISIGLVLAVLVSAVLAFVIKHDSQQAFVEQRKLEVARDALEQDWGRLLIEQSTWANPAWVGKEARQRLNMKLPDMTQVEVIIP